MTKQEISNRVIEEEMNNPHEMTKREPQDNQLTQEALSGSKKVKNRNHSRNNIGEGR